MYEAEALVTKPEYFYTVRKMVRVGYVIDSGDRIREVEDVWYHVWYASMYKDKTTLLRKAAECLDHEVADSISRKYNARLRGKTGEISH